MATDHNENKSSSVFIGSTPSGKTVAYVVSKYPKISHTFIRREIEAIESLGWEVKRFTIRSTPDSELCDRADQVERDRTTVLLSSNPLHLVAALISRVVLHPRRTAAGLCATVALWRRSHAGALRHTAYFLEACRLAGALDRDNVQHMHAHFGTNPASVALIASHLAGVSFSFTMHGASCFDPITTIGLDLKARDAAFVVTVSNYGRSQLWRFLPRSLWSKVHVVHCGLPRASVQTSPEPMVSDRRLACVARLSPEKGHCVLLDAVQLLSERGIECKIALVGGGPMEGFLRESIHRLGLDRFFEFCGPQDEAGVQAEIARARALVLPSFMEGLPVAAMEALTAGRPVIATAVAGVPELVETGRTGWLVPPGDHKALADAMADALRRPLSELESMGAAGRALVMREFIVEEQAELLETLFKGGCSRRP